MTVIYKQMLITNDDTELKIIGIIWVKKFALLKRNLQHGKCQPAYLL